MRRFHLFLTTVSLLFLSACIGEDVVDDSNIAPARLSIVTDNALGQDTLLVGDTKLYQATYSNTSGNTEQVPFTWSSSRPQFATIDADGRVTALAKGVTSIMVEAEGLSAERLLVVDQLERVEVSASATSVTAGGSLQLTAKYYNREGVETNATFTWSSSNTSAATIDANGQLSAIQSGQTMITATANGIQSEGLSITIVDDLTSAASVEISASQSSIVLGETVQFTAVVKNVNGDVLNGQAVNWASSDPAVLMVDANGLGTSLSTGMSNVTATSGNATSPGLGVLVNPPVTTTRSGTFRGVGSYNVSGTVTMSLQQNGSLQLDFTNFSTSNGPGLYIYLSNTTTGGTDIGRLPQTSGTFSFPVPSNIGINDFNNVLIWCKPFGVTFGFAQLN